MFTTASQDIWNTVEGDLSGLSMTTDPGSSAWRQYSPYQHHIRNADNIRFYGIGVVIPFGFIGNIFSIGIFLASPILRRTTTGQYLVALAVADTIVLVGELLRWFSDYPKNGNYYLPKDLRIFETSNTACKITHFLRYGGGLCSVWLTVAIALERLFAVAFPLKISRISTLRRSRIVIFVITIISFGLALFAFWHVHVDPKGKPLQCKFKDDYDKWNTVLIKFGTIIIPGVFIAILTVIIIVILYRARRKRMSQLIVVSVRDEGKHQSGLLSTETQLTIMLVTVCVATTALRAPYTIAYYFLKEGWISSDVDALRNTQIYVASRVTDLFNISNYAVNFFLYCLSGGLFREQVRRSFCRVNKAGSSCETHQISLETPVTPQLGHNDRLLKSTSKASSTEQTNNL